MMTRRGFVAAGAGGMVAALLGFAPRRDAAAEGFPVQHTEAEWRRLLTPAQYRILREEGTEPPFSSPLDFETRAGTYACAGCGNALYSSATKYDSGTGWPSFWKPLPGAIGTRKDTSLFMARTEVHCADCGGHLGHVFEDGPPPTGLRYCMDGLALTFRPAPGAGDAS